MFCVIRQDSALTFLPITVATSSEIMFKHLTFYQNMPDVLTRTRYKHQVLVLVPARLLLMLTIWCWCLIDCC